MDKSGPSPNTLGQLSPFVKGPSGPDPTQAFAGIQWGYRPTEGAGFYKGSGPPGSTPAACLTAYKDPIAKSGTPSQASLNPTIQQDFTGGRQLTLAREVLKVCLAEPGPQPEPGGYRAEDPGTDPRQVSFDGGQLPLSSCGAWAVLSECESGQHHFAKRLYCGREWCEVCGQDGSAAHRRRQARLLPKMQQVGTLGYLVVEFPDMVRRVGARGLHPDLDGGDLVPGWCYSRADLRETTNTIVEVLAGKRGAGGRGSKRKGGFFGRGLGRWHWFGDKKAGKWNPHLNILLDFDSLLEAAREEAAPGIAALKVQLQAGNQTQRVRKELAGIDLYEKRRSGYMPKPLLERIQAALRAALNCPDLIVHYSYKDKPGQIVQTVRYVTRATFRQYDWSPYMAEELWNFRNARWWGSWNSEPAWELAQAEGEGADVKGLAAVVNLQAGVCPDCGQPLKALRHDHIRGRPVYWTQPIDSVYLDIWKAQEIAGSGYYRVPMQPCDGSALSPADVMKLDRLAKLHRHDPERRFCRSSEEELLALRVKVNRLRAARDWRRRQLNAAVWCWWREEG